MKNFFFLKFKVFNRVGINISKIARLVKFLQNRKIIRKLCSLKEIRSNSLQVLVVRKSFRKVNGFKNSFIFYRRVEIHPKLCSFG